MPWRHKGANQGLGRRPAGQAAGAVKPTDRGAAGGGPAQAAKAAWAAAMKRRMRSGSLAPVAGASTPEFTSTPAGRTRAMAAATFSGVRPPARMTGAARGRRRRRG